MNKKVITTVLIIILIITIVIIYVLLSKQNNSKKVEKFSVKYKEIEVVPGTEFKENLIDEEFSYTEIPSCAFEGTDKVYTYENVELTVAKINEKNIIYSVYFINDEQQTLEGVKKSDSKELMLEKYGTNYKQPLDNKYVYTKDKVTFEIYEYLKPKMKVVGIEGNKEDVDKVYNILEDELKKLKC